MKSEEDLNSYNNYDSILKNYNIKTNPKCRYPSNNFLEEQSQFDEKYKNLEILQKPDVFKATGSIIFEENEEFTKKTLLNECHTKVSSDGNLNPLDEFGKKQLKNENELIETNEEFVTFNKTNKQLITQFLEIQDCPSKLQEKTEENLKLTSKIKNLEAELEHVILELKQVKMEWALTEERKEETEVQLKNEIKYLLNKLLQAQNKKNDDHSRNVSLNISGIKDTLKDSIVSRTSRSRSPSIYKPPSSGIKRERGYNTMRVNENYKTEEFEDNNEENAMKCENSSFSMKKTMKDLNKAN